MADLGFSRGGASYPKGDCFANFFAENGMKMKEFGPPGGRASLAPPLDPPMLLKDSISNYGPLNSTLLHRNQLNEIKYLQTLVIPSHT